ATRYARPPPHRTQQRASTPAPSLHACLRVHFTRRAPMSTLFPYTTLFRSVVAVHGVIASRHCANRQQGFVIAQIVQKFRNISQGDRKSTRLNSSHVKISYAVFCLKKKNARHCRYLTQRPG